MTSGAITTFLAGWSHTISDPLLGTLTVSNTANSGDSTLSFPTGSATEIQFRLDFTTARTTTAELSASESLLAQNLLFDSAADFDIASVLDIDLNVGVVVTDGPGNDVGGVDVTTFTAKANAADGVAGTVAIGVLGGSVAGGTAALAVTAPIVFDDPTPADRLTAADFDTSPLSDLISVTPDSASFSLSLPLTVDAGITGVTASDTLALTSSDIFNDPFGPQLTMSDQLRAFTALERDDLWDPLIRIQDWLGTLEGSSLYDGLLPIVKDVRLGDVLDLDLALRDELLMRVGHVISVTSGANPQFPTDLGVDDGDAIGFTVSYNGTLVPLSVLNNATNFKDNTATPLTDVDVVALQGAVAAAIAANATLNGNVVVTPEGARLKFAVVNASDRISLSFASPAAATALGFGTSTVALVPDFTTVQELVTLSSGRLSATYTPASEVLSIAVDVADTQTVIQEPFFLNLDVDPMTGVQVIVDPITGAPPPVNLTPTVGLGFTYGIDLTPTDEAVLANAIGGNLSGDATFDLQIGSNTPITVTVVENVLTDLRTEINQALIEALSSAGLAFDLVTATIQPSGDSGGLKISLLAKNVGDTLTVSNANSVALNELGLVNDVFSFEDSIELNTTVSGDPEGDLNFELQLGGSAVSLRVPIEILATVTAGNTSLAQLVGQIQTAIDNSALGANAVVVGNNGNELTFRIHSTRLETYLQIFTDQDNATANYLGFLNGQFDLAQSLAPTFVNEAGASITGAVDLSFDAAVMTGQFGFVGLDIEGAAARGTVTSVVTLNEFDALIDGRITIGDLTGGFGSLEATDVIDAPTGLSDDATFSLEVGGDSAVDVTVAAGAGSGGPADLQADINAALISAGLDTHVQALVTDGRLSFAVALGKSLQVSSVGGTATAELGLAGTESLESVVVAPVYSGGLTTGTGSVGLDALIAANPGSQFALYLPGWAGAAPHDAAHEITNTIVKSNLVEPSDTAETELGLVDGLNGIGVLLAPRPIPVAGAGQGRLAEDATFTITVGTIGPVGVTVEKEETLTNIDVSDLVADINAALTDAGVTGLTASLQGDRIKLTADNAGDEISIAVARPYTHTVTAPAENVFRNASFASVMQALRDAGQFLAQSGNAPVLLEELPLVGRSGSSLNDFDTEFAKVLTQIGLREASTPSLQQLKSTIDQVLSLAYGSVNVDFVFNGDDLDIALGFVNAASASIGFPLDLPGLTMLLAGGVSVQLHGLVGTGDPPRPDDVFVTLVDGTGTIDMVASSEATISLDFGVDYSAALPASFIEDTSSVDIDVDVDGPDLDFTALVGSNAVTVEDGSYVVDATYTLGLDPLGRYGFTGDDATGFGANDIDGVLTGTGDVALGLSHPTLADGDGLFIQIADLDDAGDGGDGAVAMAGQIADLLPIFEASNRIVDLLRNPEVIISGIDRLLGSVRALVQSSLSTLGELPLVGDKIMDGLKPFFDAMGEARGEVRNFLEEAWRGLVGDEDDADLIELLQNTLVSLFHTKLGILQDRPNDGDAVIDFHDLGLQERDGATDEVISDPGYIAYDPVDHPNPDNPGDESLQFNLHVGQEYMVELPFDLGLRVGDLNLSELLPNFGFDLNGMVQVDFAWNIRLGFGLSVSEGFFLDSKAKDFSFDNVGGEDVPEVQLTAEMTIPGTERTVSLALLQATVTDGTEINATVTAANGMPGALLAGAGGIFSPDEWEDLESGGFRVEWTKADENGGITEGSFDVESDAETFAGLLIDLNTDADMILNGITARPEFSDITAPKLVLTASRAPDIVRLNIVGGTYYGFLENQHEDTRAVGLGFDADDSDEGGTTLVAEFDAPVDGVVQKDIIFDLAVGSEMAEVKLLKRHLDKIYKKAKPTLQVLVDRLNVAIDLALGEGGNQHRCRGHDRRWHQDPAEIRSGAQGELGPAGAHHVRARGQSRPGRSQQGRTRHALGAGGAVRRCAGTQDRRQGRAEAACRGRFRSHHHGDRQRDGCDRPGRTAAVAAAAVAALGGVQPGHRFRRLAYGGFIHRQEDRRPQHRLPPVPQHRDRSGRNIDPGGQADHRVLRRHPRSTGRTRRRWHRGAHRLSQRAGADPLRDCLARRHR